MHDLSGELQADFTTMYVFVRCRYSIGITTLLWVFPPSIQAV